MGPELKPFGGDFQPVKSCTGRPRQKRELAVAEASEPAGRNLNFSSFLASQFLIREVFLSDYQSSENVSLQIGGHSSYWR